MSNPIGGNRVVPIPPTLGKRGVGPAVIDYILRAGAAAPSFYNTQPWRFDVGENLIDLYLDDRADTSLYDWRNLNSILACGACLENMVIAAQGRGLVANASTYPDPSRPLLAARLTFAMPSGGEESTSDWGHPLEQSIWRRHTNTLMYDESPANEACLKALREAVAEFPGIAVHFAITPEERHRVYVAASTAEEVRFARRDLHEQLHRMIRWSDAEAETDPTGYTLPSMGACGVGETFFRITKRWPVMRFMNRFGADRNQAKQACQGLLRSSACGLLTMSGQTEGDWLRAGRAMERLWLSATALGLALQPHCTIALFDWICRTPEMAVFSASEREVLTQAFERYREAFPQTKGPAQVNTGFFLFRIGRGTPVRGYTPRRDPALSPPG